MKAKELRQKTSEDLQQEYKDLLQEQFNLRMQKISGQLKKNHQFKIVKRAIARLLTILHEKSEMRS